MSERPPVPAAAVAPCVVRCSFCGHEFPERGPRRIDATGKQPCGPLPDLDAPLFPRRPVCAGCLVGPGCHSVRCPRCGYEMPEEPPLLRAIGDWLRRRRTKRSTDR